MSESSLIKSRNFIINSISIIFIMCIISVFVVAVYSITKKAILVPFSTIAFIIPVFYFSRAKFFHKNINHDIIWIVFQILSFIIMLFATFKLEVDFSWDWGLIIRQASQGVLGEEIEYFHYYAQYPNNQFLFCALSAFFHIIKWIIPTADIQVFKSASMVLACTMTQVTITFIYLIICRIYNKKIGLLAGIFALLGLHYYLYSQFAYTDIPAMLIMTIAVYLFVCSINSDKKQLYYIVIAILGGLVFKIKVMAFILFIAIAIDILLNTKGIKNTIKNLIIYVITILIVISSLSAVLNYSFKYNDEIYDKYKYPPTHWIMMGLGGTGGYNEEDVMYTMTSGNYEQKVKNNITIIKKRICEKGIFGMAKHIFCTKLKRVWSEPMCAGDDYVSRKPISNGIFQRIFSMTGDLHYICLLYAGGYYIFSILGVLISAFYKSRQNRMFAKLTFIGIVMFMSLWECNSRYIYMFMPIILLLTVDGWIEFIRKIKTVGFFDHKLVEK